MAVIPGLDLTYSIVGSAMAADLLRIVFGCLCKVASIHLSPRRRRIASCALACRHTAEDTHVAKLRLPDVSRNAHRMDIFAHNWLENVSRVAASRRK